MSLTSSGQPKLALKKPDQNNSQKAENNVQSARQLAITPSPATRTPGRAKRERPGPDVQASAPQSVEAEQGILGSVIVSNGACLAEVRNLVLVHFFYVPAHQTIYQALLDMWGSGAAIDLITLTQFLSDRKLLDSVGGPAYVTNLFTFVPSEVNVMHYVEIVRDKFFLREMIFLGVKMTRAAYGATNDSVYQLVENFSVQIDHLRHAAGGPNGSELFSISSLMAFDSQHDPDCLVGNRYIVRGGSSLWAGGSGYGKSSLILQIAVYWVCGVPCFGLKPTRPLKCLIVEAENNEGDMAEQLQGVFNGVSRIGDFDFEQRRERIDSNLIIRRTLKTGREFLGVLDDLLEADRPDIAWIDPLFAFAGCDLMNQKETTRFLRDGLFVIAEKRNVALNVVHHIGKPVRGDAKNKVEMSDFDYQYLGFGSSEIQNAFRAVNILVPIGNSGVFKLVLSKRGQRAGATSTEGKWTRTLFLRHSTEGDICWLQCEEPEGVGRPAANKLEDLLEHMSVIHGYGTAELRDLVKREGGVSERTFYRLFKEAKEKGKIMLSDGAWVLKPKRELKD